MVVEIAVIGALLALKRPQIRVLLGIERVLVGLLLGLEILLGLILIGVKVLMQLREKRIPTKRIVEDAILLRLLIVKDARSRSLLSLKRIEGGILIVEKTA